MKEIEKTITVFEALDGTCFDKKENCERYGLFPDKKEWTGKILDMQHHDVHCSMVLLQK